MTLIQFGFIFCCLILSAACSTVPQMEPKAQSPKSAQLLSQEAYAGHWEIDSCRDGIKQAQFVSIDVKDDHLILERWQWKTDTKPLFTARIQQGSQTVVQYTSTDMIDKNPVMNRSSWTWLDQRIVGTFQWLPAPGDQRDNWSAVAISQFYVNSQSPDKLVWARWGTSYSKGGKTDWDSECSYKKVQPWVQNPEDQEFDFKVKKAERRHTISTLTTY